MGQTVSFAAPASGASASFGAASGTTDYNGVLSTTASASAIVGSYNVTAASGSLTPDASFALSNDAMVGTVTWDTLSFIYDGNTHTATAHIAEEPATMCVVSPAFGPDVGDYAVTATCNGTSYAATGTNTAHITAATAVLALSDLTQTYDGSPKEATVTTTPTGVGYSVTYNGSATAPSAIGDYAVVASVDDPNYIGSQVSNVLHIVAADAPDLAVSITDDRDYAQYGSLLTYRIVVSNPGNADVTGATLASVLPATLLNATPSWQCVQVSPGASCTASGTGDLTDSALDIPAGGGVVYLYNAWVNDDQALTTDLISLKATVTAAGDVDNGNDSATDETQAVIFRDGFEENGNGAQVIDSLLGPEQVATLDNSNTQMLNLRTAWASEGRLVELARLTGSHGDRLRVEAVHIGKHLLVRMAGQGNGESQLSAWTEVTSGTQLALGLAESGEQRVLLLVGGSQDLQLKVSDGAATLQVWGPSATND